MFFHAIFLVVSLVAMVYLVSTILTEWLESRLEEDEQEGDIDK